MAPAVRIPCNAGDTGNLALISGWKDSLGGKDGNPLSGILHLENPHGLGTWQATIPRLQGAMTKVIKHVRTYTSLQIAPNS